MELIFYGAAGEVTGSCYLLKVGRTQILLDCGLVQGSPAEEARNREQFEFHCGKIDAVVLSHSHIDHSGRLPLLVKSGFKGQVYTHKACRDLCRIMLKDAGYLNEKNAEWENKKRLRKGLAAVEPLYTMLDAQTAVRHFKGLQYGQWHKLAQGISVCFHDAGHILGSSIVELKLNEAGYQRTLVFSGDLGKYNAPILCDPKFVNDADVVIMESTYGDRFHRSLAQTELEFQQVIEKAHISGGNILIPSFAVGRSQELLYFFAKNYSKWKLHQWQIFLDSPMAIEATEVYTRHIELYDSEAAEMWRNHRKQSLLPNLSFTRTANQSMKLNMFRSGAIIIAGSGMCNGGRIRHHIKHNIWRDNCHVVIVGYQAQGTPGRALVDGAKFIRLWGESIRVEATIHTIGGLSAHADQKDLIRWYRNFRSNPSLYLVHGEQVALQKLQQELQSQVNVGAIIAKRGQVVDLLS